MFYEYIFLLKIMDYKLHNSKKRKHYSFIIYRNTRNKFTERQYSETRLRTSIYILLNRL